MHNSTDEPLSVLLLELFGSHTSISFTVFHSVSCRAFSINALTVKVKCNLFPLALNAFNHAKPSGSALVEGEPTHLRPIEEVQLYCFSIPNDFDTPSPRSTTTGQRYIWICNTAKCHKSIFSNNSLLMPPCPS